MKVLFLLFCILNGSLTIIPPGCFCFNNLLCPCAQGGGYQSLTFLPFYQIPQFLPSGLITPCCQKQQTPISHQNNVPRLPHYEITPVNSVREIEAADFTTTDLKIENNKSLDKQKKVYRFNYNANDTDPGTLFCYDGEPGVDCCNKEMRAVIIESLSILKSLRPNIDDTVAAKAIAVSLEHTFHRKFETIVSQKEFVFKTHYRGKLFCKFKNSDNFFLAYATPTAAEIDSEAIRSTKTGDTSSIIGNPIFSLLKHATRTKINSKNSRNGIVLLNNKGADNFAETGRQDEIANSYHNYLPQQVEPRIIQGSEAGDTRPLVIQAYVGA